MVKIGGFYYSKDHHSYFVARVTNWNYFKSQLQGTKTIALTYLVYYAECKMQLEK